METQQNPGSELPGPHVPPGTPVTQAGASSSAAGAGSVPPPIASPPAVAAAGPLPPSRPPEPFPDIPPPRGPYPAVGSIPVYARPAQARPVVMESKRRERPPKVREFAALLAAVAVCDVTIYSGGGFAGLGAFFLLFPLVLLLGAQRRRLTRDLWALYSLLVLLAGRLVWLGSEGAVAIGLALLSGLSMALTGLRPFVLEGSMYVVGSVVNGIDRLALYVRNSGKVNPSLRGSTLVWAVPLAALGVFGGIFILANPDLRDTVSDWIQTVVRTLTSRLPSVGRVVFWAAVLWATAGLLRPLVTREVARAVKRWRERVELRGVGAAPHWVYPMARNTFASVIVLFAAYLVFEIYYLWFREFPKGFFYSGYAHQGAAWLTFALALATAVMGATFQGGLLADARIGSLKRLAAVWAAENFVLAMCVFHRTKIYIDYNGLSRMRVVALLGIAVVVAGFILVVWKVRSGRNLLWLVRRQLWALGLTLLLLAIAPVDFVVTQYNVSQIVKGNLAPSVQIATHPIGPEGLASLLPLLGCGDATIREGIAAYLAEEEIRLRESEATAGGRGWSFAQLARRAALGSAGRHGASWVMYREDAKARAEALETFRKYARQWYD